MPAELQVVDILNPITALAIVQTDPNLLLLAGQGPLLRVFDLETGKLHSSSRIFHTQTIHGIQVQTQHRKDSLGDRLKCLIWGGHSVRLVNLVAQSKLSGQFTVDIHLGVKELVTEDWVLDTCFPTDNSREPGVAVSGLEALLLTSHNVLFSIHVNHLSGTDTADLLVLTQIAAGPPSILYSAHLAWLESGQILAAAGTVFGEVLLWSCHLEESVLLNQSSIIKSLLHTFAGHEGSVFGVRISQASSDSYEGEPRRVLASCSDDRTVRIWDISGATDSYSSVPTNNSPIAVVGTGFGRSKEDHERYSQGCLATAMGHISRVWGLRYTSSQGPSRQILTYGEDSTAVTWIFDTSVEAGEAVSKPSQGLHRLRIQNTYGFHSGKNIWATAVREQDSIATHVSTGGADGRITYYPIPRSGGDQPCNTLVGQWTMQDLVRSHSLGRQPRSDSTMHSTALGPTLSTTNAVFLALRGTWELKRSLKSARPTYPSGKFRGTASLSPRPPTDEAYDAEYVYYEEGQLVTDQGFSLNGSRSYVYRFQKSTDTITAWFTKTDKDAAVDYLFHKIAFSGLVDERSDKSSETIDGITASGHHLCVEDDYSTTYDFRLSGGILKDWGIRYDVKGPKKDYIADASYTKISGDQAPDMISNDERYQENSATQGMGAELLRDSFKNYSWISTHAFIATTAQGRVLLGSLDVAPTKINNSARPPSDAFRRPEVVWSHITQLVGLSSYSILAGVPEHQIALLGGCQGNVFLYLHSNRSVTLIMKLPRKISGLIAQQLREHSTAVSGTVPQSIGVVATCLGSTTAHAFAFDIESYHPNEKDGISSQQSILHLPPNFVVTSAGFIAVEDLLVLGSRSGALSFYDRRTFKTGTDALSACCCLRHVHDEDAVTVIKRIPPQGQSNKGSFYLLTAGKNGKCAVHYVLIHRHESILEVQFETVHVVKPPFGPNIEGACFDRVTNDLLLWGFRSKDFAVWNESRQTEVLALECGGSHRSWAYSLKNDGSDGGQLVWTKASSCYIHTQTEASHRVLQAGSHGREIKAMAIWQGAPDVNNEVSALIATGAEDTVIRISSYSTKSDVLSGNVFQHQDTMTEHTTGIQQLRWSPGGQFLFSAGGCEEFFAWRIRLLPCLAIRIGIVCHSRCPPVTSSSDLRIMHFDIAVIDNEECGHEEGCFLLSMVYSDSSLRLWRFDPAKPQDKYELLYTATYGTCCLTQIQHIQLGKDLFILTAGTDGYLALWPLTAAIQRKGITTSDHGLHHASISSITLLEPNLTWHARTQLHQNSIKCLVSLTLSDSEILAATGGDDNALAFTRITRAANANANANSSDPPSFSTLLIPKAHASTITAIQHAGMAMPKGTRAAASHEVQHHRFLTTSNDQRLKAWVLDIDLRKVGVEGFSVTRGENVHTTIADAACMARMEGRGEAGKERVDDGEGKGKGKGKGKEKEREGNVEDVVVVVVAGIGIETWKLDS